MTVSASSRAHGAVWLFPPGRGVTGYRHGRQTVDTCAGVSAAALERALAHGSFQRSRTRANTSSANTAPPMLHGQHDRPGLRFGHNPSPSAKERP